MISHSSQDDAIRIMLSDHAITMMLSDHATLDARYHNHATYWITLLEARCQTLSIRCYRSHHAVRIVSHY